MPSAAITATTSKSMPLTSSDWRPTRSAQAASQLLPGAAALARVRAAPDLDPLAGALRLAADLPVADAFLAVDLRRVAVVTTVTTLTGVTVLPPVPAAASFPDQVTAALSGNGFARSDSGEPGPGHTNRRQADSGGPPHPGSFFGSIDASRLPRLAALGDQWPTLAAQDTYSDALEALIDGLLAQAVH